MTEVELDTEVAKNESYSVLLIVKHIYIKDRTRRNYQSNTNITDCLNIFFFHFSKHSQLLLTLRLHGVHVTIKKERRPLRD